MVEEKERKEEPREEEEEEEEGDKDLLYISELVRATGELIDRIRDMIKDVIETTIRELDGARLGKEVGELYRSLREAGVPEEEAMAMAKRFFEAKLNSMPNLAALLETLTKSFSASKAPVIITGGKKAALEGGKGVRIEIMKEEQGEREERGKGEGEEEK